MVVPDPAEAVQFPEWAYSCWIADADRRVLGDSGPTFCHRAAAP